MGKYDRYVVGQLFTSCLFFAFILVAIFWFDKALRMFDRLLGKVQSTWLLLELILLTLPPVVASILPIASFAASVFVCNRLISDSEALIMRATGRSTFNSIKPNFVFGLSITILMACFTHFIVPESNRTLNAMREQIDKNISSSFLTAGEFLHPTPGVTLYVGAVTQNSELRRVFVSDQRDKRNTITLSSARAYIVHSRDSVNLLMVNGTAQNFVKEDKKLLTAHFDEFLFDISQLVEVTPVSTKTLAGVNTAELIQQPEQVKLSTKATLGEISVELHNRFTQPLLCVIAAVLGAATLLSGGYSRFGVWRQICFAFFLLVVLKLLEGAVTSHVLSSNGHAVLLYAPSVTATFTIWIIIRSNDNPYLIKFIKTSFPKLRKNVSGDP